MKKIIVFTIILLSIFLSSCSEEKNGETKKETTKIAVKTTELKTEITKDVKSYFGTLKFSKSTTFVAQQSGVITKLNAVPGQTVRKGEVIVVYPPMNHQLQIDQVNIQRNKTLQDYKRQKKLYEVGAVTKLSVEDYKTQLNIEQKTVQQLQGVNIITAPFSGIITQVNASIGQEMGMEIPIFSMAQTNTIEIEFFVIPREISEIHIGAPAFFMENYKKINGKITKKSIQLDERRKAFLVTASFDEKEIRFVGNTIDVVVETGEATKGIWIPSSALKKSGNTYYVFVAENQIAKKKIVQIGTRNMKEVQIIQGLTLSNVLITAGSEKVDDNSPIEILE